MNEDMAPKKSGAQDGLGLDDENMEKLLELLSRYSGQMSFDQAAEAIYIDVYSSGPIFSEDIDTLEEIFSTERVEIWHEEVGEYDITVTIKL